MRINCTGTGKRFNRDWVFRNFSYEFLPGCKYAITGPNGSGKSTLLQVLAGAMQASEGKLEYQDSKLGIDAENFYAYFSLAAPYLELIEEMTLVEFLQFHYTFKEGPGGITIAQIIDEMNLSAAANKEIRFFSSGMKQRVKLGQAIFSATPVLFLDEPVTNLDDEGILLYHRLINNYCENKMVIVSSNDEQEYSFCDHVIKITDYKMPAS